MSRGALLILCFLAPAMAASQSLGEVAKKEKKRREQNREEAVKARVITDQEVATVKAEEATEDEGKTLEPVPSQQADAPATRESGPTDRQREEAEWRSRLAEAKERLKLAQERYDYLNALHLTPGEYYVDEKGQPLIASLAQLRRLVTEAKAELDRATEAMDGLREEARKAGVPPGWLR